MPVLGRHEVTLSGSARIVFRYGYDEPRGVWDGRHEEVTVERPWIRLAGPVLDAADPVGLARFYERLLGWEIARMEGPQAGNPAADGWALLRSPDGLRKLEFQWEPNYGRPTWPPRDGEQLMMMHLDIGVDDLETGVAWALECGATIADHQPQPDVRVMLDPEGHPFCLFPDER